MAPKGDIEQAVEALEAAEAAAAAAAAASAVKLCGAAETSDVEEESDGFLVVREFLPLEKIAARAYEVR